MKVKSKRKSELEVKITLNDREIEEIKSNFFTGVTDVDVTVTNTDGYRRVDTGVLTRLVNNVVDSVYRSTATEKQ